MNNDIRSGAPSNETVEILKQNHFSFSQSVEITNIVDF